MAEKEENVQKEEKVEEINEVKETENVVVEQLDDVDFEKEVEELKKEKKSKKKNIIFLIIGILVIVAVGVSAFFVINKGNPKAVVQDFVTSFNSQDFETAIGMIDVKGFYALNTTSDGEEVDENTNYEKFYTKFDERYEKAEGEEDYEELLEVFDSADKETLKTVFEGMQLTVTEIKEPVLIQNTKGLYKVTVNIDMTNGEQTESGTYNFYINKTNREYKIVGGEIPETLLYMMFLTEYYSALQQ